MTVNLLTIKDIRRFLVSELENLYDPAEIEPLARIIIDSVSGNAPAWHRYDPGRELEKGEIERITGIAGRLKTGEPYQYVLGETWFCGCRIIVNRCVLIPRPETELMTDMIIRENTGFDGNILDLGTGSGCIAVALAKHLGAARVTAVDNSECALSVAAENAAINNVKVDFHNMDILDASFALPFKAAIIVSNPPYVRHSEKAGMRKNVTDFEPHSALFVDDNDPLVYYRAIAEIARDVLGDSGKIYMEINEAMGTKIEAMMKSLGFSDIKTIKDLNEKDRIIKGIKNG